MGRLPVVLLSVLTLLAAGLAITPVVAAAPYLVAAHPAATPRPGDFGSGAATSADVAVNEWGDAASYRLELGRESSGFAWRESAVPHPAGYDDSAWTGYRRVTGTPRSRSCLRRQ